MEFIEVTFIVVAVLTSTCYCQPEFYHMNPADTLMTKRYEMDFTLELFGYSSTAGESYILSPLAVISTLSLLYQGAKGDTQSEMTVVGRGEFGQIFDTNIKHIIDFINTDQGSRQKNNDSIIGGSGNLWMKQSFLLRSAFEAFIPNHNIGIKVEDFSLDNSDHLAESAGKWLNENAHNRANNVIFINFGYSLFLINELHLEAKWKYQFVSLNYETYFYPSPSQYIIMPMMERTAEFPYYEDESVKVISLPLVKSHMHMIIILPINPWKLEEIEMKLTGKKLLSYISALDASDKSEKITVTIPKFFSRQYLDLSNELESMGLQSMFNESANFTGISDQPLFITKLIGNLASMRITEDGINVNYADNSADGSEHANPSQSNTEKMDTMYTSTARFFYAYHPFLYFISDNQKNILWIGRYTVNNSAVEVDKETQRSTQHGLQEFEQIMEKIKENDKIKSSEQGQQCAVQQPTGYDNLHYGVQQPMTHNLHQGVQQPMDNNLDYDVQQLMGYDNLHYGAQQPMNHNLHQGVQQPMDNNLDYDVQQLTGYDNLQYGVQQPMNHNLHQGVQQPMDNNLDYDMLQLLDDERVFEMLQFAEYDHDNEIPQPAGQFTATTNPHDLVQIDFEDIMVDDTTWQP